MVTQTTSPLCPHVPTDHLSPMSSCSYRPPLPHVLMFLQATSPPMFLCSYRPPLPYVLMFLQATSPLCPHVPTGHLSPYVLMFLQTTSPLCPHVPTDHLSPMSSCSYRPPLPYVLMFLQATSPPMSSCSYRPPLPYVLMFLQTTSPLCPHVPTDHLSHYVLMFLQATSPLCPHVPHTFSPAGTIGISPLFQEQYVSPSAGAGDGVMSVLVTLEDRGLRNSQIQLYIYSDLYAVFLGGSPWTYGYLHPFFSTRPSAQSSVVTWQDVKARASVCSSGSKSYVTFPVNIFLSSRSLFNLGQLFVYFDFAYGSVYSRSTLLLNVNAGERGEEGRGGIVWLLTIIPLLRLFAGV